jgi:2,4-dienoyl-CoA reductase-like NADH-dependent reductase (Old Yellow Enzyme family)
MNTGNHPHAALFASWRLNGVALSNRLAVAPMTRISATPEGLTTEAMARYYERFARGGFALVITEGIYTDQAYSQGYANQPGLSDLAQALAWRGVVDAVHAAGGKIFAQLLHAGALSQFNRFRNETVGPSAVRPKGKQMAVYRGSGAYPVPRAMSEPEIAEALDGFARAARLAIEVAGFDGVEIHGANGYLLDQFLTDYSNRRDDAWGGEIGQRVRLSAEAVRAVRKAVGERVPVGIRISQGKVNDFTHKWAEGEGGAEIVFRRLAEAKADYIHVTEFEAWRPAFGDAGPSLVHLARKHAPGVTVIANGGLHDPSRAMQAMEDGTDLVALGRGALANPAWPRQVANGCGLNAFDPALLSPLGDIKPVELAA